MTRLAGKIAIITGASSGIGRGVAQAFAHEGAGAVIINYPTDAGAEAAEEVAREVEARGAQALLIRADVSQETEVTNMCAEAIDRFGRIDILVNNAGVAHSNPVEDLPVDVWDHVLAVHLRGTFLMTRALLPHMYAQPSGRIINTVSQLAYIGAPGLSAYCAAKGAILSFSRAVALEIGQRDVRINCVAPGTTMPPLLGNVSAETLQAVKAAIPTGRIAEVDDIVGSYVFLASEDGRHYQGQCLSPNGGDCFL